MKIIFFITRIKTIIIFPMSPARAFRVFFNRLGLAWWVRVETKDPSVTYWFGPFLSKRTVHGRLPLFLDDLIEEGSQDIDHRLIRTRKVEPLTT